MANNKLRSLRMLWNVELDDEELASALEMTVAEWRQLAEHAGMGLRCMEAWYVPSEREIIVRRDAIKAKWTPGEREKAQKRAVDAWTVPPPEEIETDAQRLAAERIMSLRSIFHDEPRRIASSRDEERGTGDRDP